MQCHLSCYFFSLTTDMNRVSQVPAVQHRASGSHNHGVRVHYVLLLAVCEFPFRLQSMVTLKEGDQWQMWEFIPI